MYTLSTALSPLSPRTRNNLRCAPMYLLMVISTMINLMTSAAPVTKPDDDDDKSITGTARDGPYNITVQAGIAGAILIIAGFLLCFFGYLGILGGLLLICCSRLGVAVLGALALYSLGLWILGWQSGGVITSRVGRGILLGVLAVVGFFIGLCRERETVIVGSALVGAYSFVVGVDMFAHTGFVNQADSFINSKNTVDIRATPEDKFRPLMVRQMWVEDLRQEMYLALATKTLQGMEGTKLSTREQMIWYVKLLTSAEGFSVDEAIEKMQQTIRDQERLNAASRLMEEVAK
ncbi:hypothetical protein BGZ59_005965 [Podila verticillata]|nr:hypothetical protein BGZ59_005965 [Podila verticillata]